MLPGSVRRSIIPVENDAVKEKASPWKARPACTWSHYRFLSRVRMRNRATSPTTAAAIRTIPHCGAAALVSGFSIAGVEVLSSAAATLAGVGDRVGAGVEVAGADVAGTGVDVGSGGSGDGVGVGVGVEVLEDATAAGVDVGGSGVNVGIGDAGGAGGAVGGTGEGVGVRVGGGDPGARLCTTCVEDADRLSPGNVPMPANELQPAGSPLCDTPYDPSDGTRSPLLPPDWFEYWQERPPPA